MLHKTYVINQSQIKEVLSMRDYVATIENAFKLYGEGKVQMPAKVYLTFEKGDLRCMPVYMPTIGFAGVKNVNVHPRNEHLPAVMATITLIDPTNGFPLAIMDGTHITNMRTGAAGGVATQYLARKNVKVAAFIGSGAQARTQLQAIMVVRPDISKVSVYGRDEEKREHFADWAADKYNIGAISANSIEEAVSEADIVTTTTPVHSPIVKAEWIKPGTHINAIGADANGKQELDPKILKNARIVIDNWDQASHSGEINVPLSQGIITKEDVYADIGEVVTAIKQGRTSDDQITIFDSTGLAIQDISSASAIFKHLTEDEASRNKLKTFSFF